MGIYHQSYLVDSFFGVKAERAKLFESSGNITRGAEQSTESRRSGRRYRGKHTVDSGRSAGSVIDNPTVPYINQIVVQCVLLLHDTMSGMFLFDFVRLNVSQLLTLSL